VVKFHKLLYSYLYLYLTDRLTDRNIGSNILQPVHSTQPENELLIRSRMASCCHSSPLLALRKYDPNDRPMNRRRFACDLLLLVCYFSRSLFPSSSGLSTWIFGILVAVLLTRPGQQIFRPQRKEKAYFYQRTKFVYRSSDEISLWLTAKTEQHSTISHRTISRYCC